MHGYPKKIDTINQVIYPEMIYQIIEPDGKVSEIREQFSLLPV
jgi:hypothetical protein